MHPLQGQLGWDQARKCDGGAGVQFQPTHQWRGDDGDGIHVEDGDDDDADVDDDHDIEDGDDDNDDDDVDTVERHLIETCNRVTNSVQRYKPAKLIFSFYSQISKWIGISLISSLHSLWIS